MILLGFIGGYIYYSQLLNEGPDILPPPKPKTDLTEYESLNINFDVIGGADYQSLRIFGEIPVVPDRGGKQNIFDPLSDVGNPAIEPTPLPEPSSTPEPTPAP